MQETAKGCVELSGSSLERARIVEARAKRAPEEFDADAAWKRFRELLGET